MARDQKLRIIIQGKDEASGVLGKITSGLKSIGLASLGLRYVKDVFNGITDAMMDAVKGAASFQGISEAFEGMARATGRAGPEILEAFKKNSAGMLSNRDAMLAYNKAAQLVSDDFANKLPEAMGMLSKVASATGQDMGFLTNSLVTGIGRLSPLILDNLGISVDLSEAYEVYAASIGKSVDELTKQEQQTALTNQVMEKLAENTKNLPDVAGQADTKMAALGATFQDLKDKVGMFLLPAFQSILDVATTVLDGVMNKWSVFTQAMDSGMGFWDALRVTFTDLTPLIDAMEVAWNTVAGVINTIVIPAFNKAVEIIGLVVKSIKEWLDRHPGFLEAMLIIGGGIFILTTAASLAATAVKGLTAAFAVLTSPVAILVGAIAILVAWLSGGEGGLGGALERAKIALEQLAFIILFVVVTAADWLRTRIQELAETIRTSWDNVKKWTEDHWNEIKTFFENTWNDIKMRVETAIEDIRLFLEDKWNAIKDAATRIWEDIKTAIQNIINGVKTFIENTWNDIQTKAEAAWENIKTTIQPALDFLKGAFEGAFNAIMSIIQPVIDTINSIGGAIHDAAVAVGLATNDMATDINSATAAVNSIIGTAAGAAGVNMAPTATSAISGISNTVTGAINHDYGGRGFPGSMYAIRPAVKTEYFVPDSAGEFIPQDQMGGRSITINFNGSGGPRDQREANEQGEMLLSALRAQGVRV